MSTPSIVGYIKPGIGNEPNVWAYCKGCNAYRQLRNVRPWPGVSDHFGECQCGSSLVGEPKHPEPAA